MNNNPQGSPVVYERQIRQALATPSSVRATPDLEAAAAAYMAGQAATQQEDSQQNRKEALQQQYLSEKARQFTTSLNEQARQFDASTQNSDQQWDQKLADQKKTMDTWSKQNKWANAVAVLNLGAQAVSSWDQNKKMEEQQTFNRQMQENYDKQLQMSQDALRQQKESMKQLNLQDAAKGYLQRQPSTSYTF